MDEGSTLAGLVSGETKNSLKEVLTQQIGPIPRFKTPDRNQIAHNCGVCIVPDFIPEVSLLQKRIDLCNKSSNSGISDRWPEPHHVTSEGIMVSPKVCKSSCDERTFDHLIDNDNMVMSDHKIT